MMPREHQMTPARTSLALGLFMAASATFSYAQPSTPTTLTLNSPSAIYAGVPTPMPFTVSAGPGDMPGLGGPYQTQTEIGEISPWPVMAGEPVRVDIRAWACMPPLPGCGSVGPVTVSDVGDPSTTCTTPLDTTSYFDCTLTFQSSGEHTLIAVYAGSGAFSASSGTRTLAVGPRVFTLADGVTGPFFDTYLLLANPGATPEPVTMTLFRDDGASTDISTVISPYERATWKTDDLPTFGEGAFSAKVTVPSGRPLFVERATYFANDYRAGHAAMGRAPSARAYLAEGCQNGQFDTYLLIGNQAAGTANVLVSFLLDDGQPVNKTYAVPAGSRLSIASADIPELAGRSFGIDVVSDLPVAVEQSMYFGPGYRGGHSEVAVARPSTTWLFAEGATGPRFDTFLLLANPDYDLAASAAIRFHTSDGRTVTRTRTVPIRGRVTIEIESEDPALADTTFWIDVESDVPLVAERAMYWSSGSGAAWTDGHVSAGATAAGPRWGFAEGILGGGLDFKTFLLLANPGTSPATVDVQYLPTGGGPITRAQTVPAGGRLTINVEAEVPALRDVPFGATVTARSGGAIVAERSIYWTRNGPVFIGGTNTVGLGF